MNLFSRQNLQLAYSHLLGFLMYLVILFLFTTFFYFFLTIIILVVGNVANLFYEDLQLVGSIIIFVALIIFVLPLGMIYLASFCATQSLLIGGFYGSTLDSVLDQQFSIKSFFQHSFRHVSRLTSFQLLIIALMFPIFLVITIGLWIFNDYLFNQTFYLLLTIFFVILLLPCIIFFQHTPIFIIRHNMKIWRSIRLSFQLFLKQPLRVLLSGVLFFGAFLLIHIVFGTIVFIYAILSAPVLHTLFNVVDANFIQTLLGYLVILFWIIVIFPISLTCSIFILISQYHKYFQPYINASLHDQPQDPIFQYK